MTVMARAATVEGLPIRQPWLKDAFHAVNPGEQHVQAKPDGKVKNYAHYGGGDCGQRTGKAGHSADMLNVGGAGEYPEEAGGKGHPEGDRRAGKPAPDAAYARARRQGSPRTG